MKWKIPVATLLILVIFSGHIEAQAHREISDVRSELESISAARHRVGVALVGGSRLFGEIETIAKDRFRLNEQSMGKRTIKYEDVRSFLDPDNGAEIGIVRIVRPSRFSANTKVLISIGAAIAALFVVAWYRGAFVNS